MELRGEDKEVEMPSSLEYCNSADPERRRRGTNQSSAHGDASFQTLDQHHQHQHPSCLLHTNTPTRRDPATGGSSPRFIIPPTPSSVTGGSSAIARYRECQKNHAASTGGHVVDGCGEFMPAGDEGTPGSLTCAACDCHRSFHRKEVDGEHVTSCNYNYSFYNMVAPSRSNSQWKQVIPPPQRMQAPAFHRQHQPGIMMSFGGVGGGGPAESSTEDLNTFKQSLNNGVERHQQPKKRFRTKFNQAQKEKMFEFAEKIGWRLTKEDEEEVQRFCSEANVRRQVFKVWMHNNKQAMKKKQL